MNYLNNSFSWVPLPLLTTATTTKNNDSNSNSLNFNNNINAKLNKCTKNFAQHGSLSLLFTQSKKLGGLRSVS